MDRDVIVIEHHDLQEPSAAVRADVENPVTVEDRSNRVSHGVVNVVIVHTVLAGTVSNLDVRPARPSTYLDSPWSTTAL